MPNGFNVTAETLQADATREITRAYTSTVRELVS